MRRHLFLGSIMLISLGSYAPDLFAANEAALADALIKHVSEDKRLLWGWSPGGTRAPVPVAHDVFVTQFKLWAWRRPSQV